MPSVFQQPGSRYIYLQVENRWFVFDSLSVPLGSGAVGVVFKGYDCNNYGPVAVKVIRPEYAENASVRHLVREEASMRFQHPNIVRMLGVCECDFYHGPMFVLSSFVQGQTFDSYCRNRISGMDQKSRMLEIVKCSITILQALDYVHNIGFIHRDVKPSNIMVTYNGDPLLMDLGIAKYEYGPEQVAQGFTGTALYASPETILNEPVDLRTDIYSMGVTMYELLTGYNPFEAESKEAVMDLQLKVDLPRNRIIPRRLYRILKKATQKNKSKRYGSAAEFADKLISFMTDNV